MARVRSKQTIWASKDRALVPDNHIDWDLFRCDVLKDMGVRLKTFERETNLEDPLVVAEYRWDSTSGSTVCVSDSFSDQNGQVDRTIIHASGV